MGNSDTEADYCETKKKTVGSETEEDDDFVKRSSSKRGREEEAKCNNPSESKKLKKRGCFHWNWSDECTILNNFYEFAGKNGSYSKEFYHFVKNKLSVEVSNSQLSDKVYRLRKRFFKDKSRMMMMKDGKMKLSNANNSNSNYEKLFEMSSNIWGDQNQNEESWNQWTKAEAVDRSYGKMLKKVFDGIKLDITCIPPNVFNDIRKDWEDVQTTKNEYQLNNAKLLVQISHIRCTQYNT